MAQYVDDGGLVDGRAGFRRAGLGEGGVGAGRLVPRQPADGLHPGGIRHTETGAEVPGIRHAVQNEEQRLIGDGIEKLIKGERLLEHTAHRDDPLMLHTVPRDAVQTLRVRAHRADAAFSFSHISCMRRSCRLRST